MIFRRKLTLLLVVVVIVAIVIELLKTELGVKPRFRNKEEREREATTASSP